MSRKGLDILDIPRNIYLYNEGIKGVDFRGLKKFIQGTFKDTRVHNVKLEKRVVSMHGLLFDFAGTQKAFAAMKYAAKTGICHIILTPRLFATYDEQKRVHIRAALFSYPSVISTSGIVEGPAKPREYYFYKQKYMSLGVWEKEEAGVKKRFRGRFIDYQDRRMEEVLKGYLSQAIFFYTTGEPFCKRKSCRLFNAHWQEDLVYAQIRAGGFCSSHRKVLERFRRSRTAPKKV